MAIENADDMLLFFDPDDFGSEASCSVDGVPMVFKGILTDANDPASPGIRAQITTATPRFICRRSDAGSVPRDTVITIKGVAYQLKSQEFRGDLSTLVLKQAHV